MAEERWQKWRESDPLFEAVQHHYSIRDPGSRRRRIYYGRCRESLLRLVPPAYRGAVPELLPMHDMSAVLEMGMGNFALSSHIIYLYIYFIILLYYIMYYYIILYFIILYYIILYFIILYYIILYFIILYYIVLYYVLLYYIILYYVILYYIILYYIVFMYALKTVCSICETRCLRHEEHLGGHDGLQANLQSSWLGAVSRQDPTVQGDHTHAHTHTHTPI